jgi:hypothetical protein
MGKRLLSLITLLCLAAVKDFGEYEEKNVKGQINMQQSNKLYNTMTFNFKIFVGLKLNLSLDNPTSTYYEFWKTVNLHSDANKRFTINIENSKKYFKQTLSVLIFCYEYLLLCDKPFLRSL